MLTKKPAKKILLPAHHAVRINPRQSVNPVLDRIQNSIEAARCTGVDSEDVWGDQLGYDQGSSEN
jgi:hypothetical protein